jgi:glycosyltransferase involved in cell wall biosynthesis
LKFNKEIPQKIKILYIIGTLDIGGTEKQLVELIKRLDKNRFNIAVCCLSQSGPLISSVHSEGIPVEVIGFRGFRHSEKGYLRNLPRIISLFVQLTRYIKKEQPHILHGFLFWAYILGTYAAKLAGVSHIISSRRGLGMFKQDKRHYLFLEKVANHLTEIIIANSEAVRRDTIQQEKVPASKIMMVYNGIDTALYEIPPDQKLRAALNIGEKSKIVSIIANFIHYKGHGFFLHACSEVRKKLSDVKFMLIGDGPLKKDMKELAEDLNIEKDVLFLGSRKDIPALLSITDIVVLSSLEEGFSNAILEAMAAGKPVIATHVGGNPEAILQGETGLLVLPKNSDTLAGAMIQLLENPDIAVKMGKAGRERVKQEFSMDRMVQSIEQIYEKVMQVEL